MNGRKTEMSRDELVRLLRTVAMRGMQAGQAGQLGYGFMDFARDALNPVGALARVSGASDLLGEVSIPGVGSLLDLVNGKLPGLSDVAGMLWDGPQLLPATAGNGAHVTKPAFQTIPSYGMVGQVQVPGNSVQVSGDLSTALARLAQVEQVNSNQTQQIARLISALEQLPGMLGQLFNSNSVPNGSTIGLPFGLGSTKILAAAAAEGSVKGTPKVPIECRGLVLNASELTGVYQGNPLDMLEITDIKVAGSSIFKGGKGNLPAQVYGALNPARLGFEFDVDVNAEVEVVLINRHATLDINCSGALYERVYK